MKHHNKNAAVEDIAAVYKDVVFVCCDQYLDLFSFGDSPNAKIESWSALKMQLIAVLTFYRNTWKYLLNTWDSPSAVLPILCLRVGDVFRALNYYLSMALQLVCHEC